MTVAAFDTLTVSKDLQQAGIQEIHAKAIALTVKQGQGDRLTKQDIALLKSDIDHLKSGNEQLKSDQLRTQMQSDIAWIRRLAFCRSRTEDSDLRCGHQFGTIAMMQSP